MLVTEAMGRTLAPEPLIPSIVLAGRALALGGSAAQKNDVAGARDRRRQGAGARASRRPGRATTSRASPFAPSARAAATGCAAEASGVWGGQLADALRRRARTAGARRRARRHRAVPRAGARPRASRPQRQTRVDSLNAAIARARRRRAERDAACSARRRRLRAARRASSTARTVALCGEMLGGMSEAFERTLAYLQGAQAVRRRDRQLPGAQAPRGAHVHRARAVALGGDGGGARARRRAAPTQRCWCRSPRRACRTRTAWSPTKPCRCTAASA